MGVTESKLLAETVLDGCREAEANRKTKFDVSILSRTKPVKNAVTSVLKQLPSQIISKQPPSQTPSKGRRPVARAAGRLETRKIKVVQSVKDSFDVWKAQPSKFLTHVTDGYQQGQSHNLATATLGNQQLLPQFYLQILKTEDGLMIGRIRLRVFYFVLCRLVRSYSPGSYDKDLVSLLAKVIERSDLIGEGLDSIQKKIRTWLTRGERFEQLVQRLGGPGILFLLPEDFGERIWTHELRLKKCDEKEQLLAGLKERRIHEEACEVGAHDVARVVIDYLVEQLLQSLGNEASRALIILPEPMTTAGWRMANGPATSDREGNYRATTSSQGQEVQHKRPRKRQREDSTCRPDQHGDGARRDNLQLLLAATESRHIDNNPNIVRPREADERTQPSETMQQSTHDVNTYLVLPTSVNHSAPNEWIAHCQLEQPHALQDRGVTSESQTIHQHPAMQPHGANLLRPAPDIWDFSMQFPENFQVPDTYDGMWTMMAPFPPGALPGFGSN